LAHFYFARRCPNVRRSLLSSRYLRLFFRIWHGFAPTYNIVAFKRRRLDRKVARKSWDGTPYIVLSYIAKSSVFAAVTQ
jgi:hypothetical protein